MKKTLLLVLIAVVAVFTVYKVLSKKEEPAGPPKDNPVNMARNTSAFTTSFNQLMSRYYTLKDAFVEWDTAGINHAAVAMMNTNDSVKWSELKGDTAALETAKNYFSSIDGELKGMVGEPTIDEKRKSFNMLSSELYDLIRVVRYDGQVIYHVRCPMAFNDSLEGFWLTNSPQIENPYLGKHHPNYQSKMLGCGEIVDSLDFTKNP